MVLLCVQPEANLFSGNGMGLYDRVVGAPTKIVYFCFAQYPVNFSWVYSREDTIVWIHSQNVVTPKNYIAIQSSRRIIQIQKQPFKDVLKKKCSENMQQIYRRTPMQKCDFN